MVERNIPDTAEVFDHFAALMTVEPRPGASLVFYGAVDDRGMAMAAAAKIAGAACLGVDAHAERVKVAMQRGICDFMVNTLDDALSILKDETRRSQPVAIALVGDPERSVAEMLDRGVRPDLVPCGCIGSEAFLKRGAKFLPAAMVTPCSLVVTWGASQDATVWLPRMDDIAVNVLEDDSDLRARWIRLAPKYLQKNLSRERYVRMRVGELTHFVELLRQRAQSGEIAVPVQISGNGLPVLQLAPANSSAAA